MGFLSGERNGGLAERLDHGNAALAQPVAAAGLDHDVARPVFLGDPYRGILGAYRAAHAVHDFQHLAPPELQGAGPEFDPHGFCSLHLTCAGCILARRGSNGVFSVLACVIGMHYRPWTCWWGSS